MLKITFFFYLSDKEAQARRRTKPASETSMESSKQVELVVGKSIFTFNSWKIKHAGGAAGTGVEKFKGCFCKA